MDLPHVLLALRAVQEGELPREELPRFLSIAENWQRAGLQFSGADILHREFRISLSKVRRWEAQLAGRKVDRIGQYDLKRRIGQGGMGVVFEAHHPNLERPVALKVLSPVLGGEPEAVQRFLREAKSAGHFNHPNIVHAYDAGIDNDLPYLVMEYIDGENLFQLLLRQGPIPPEVAFDWLLQAASALSVVEAAGWIHGDGKPSNWILAPGGVLKLADHGLCRPPGVVDSNDNLFGTPPYLAPELLEQGALLDIRSDLYSLGATFYHLLSGRPPYETNKVLVLKKLLKKEPIPPLLTLRPELPVALVNIVDRLLQHNPEDRYPNTGVLLDELERITGKRAARLERPSGGPAHPPRTLLRVALLAALVVAVTTLGVVLAKNWSSESAPPPQRVESDSGATPQATSVLPPSEMAARWGEMLALQPRDYAPLFDWLETEGATLPQRPQWEQELLQALQQEADPVRERFLVDVGKLRNERRYGGAGQRLEEFPKRLRVGSYATWHRQLAESVKGERDQRLSSMLLKVRTELAAQNWLRARAEFRRISEEPLSEQESYRRDLSKELLSLPWQYLGYVASGSLRSEGRDRRARADAALAADNVPEAQWFPLHDPLREMSLQILHEVPQLVVAADNDELRLSLLESGLLATLDPQLLSVVERDALSPQVVEDVTPWELERRAAQLFGTVQEACQLWSAERARPAWEEFRHRHDLQSTIVVQAFGSELQVLEKELELGAFLRSDAMVAVVSGVFGATPTLYYEFDTAAETPPACHEWRWQQDIRWQSTETGLIPAEDGLLEWSLPVEYVGEVGAGCIVVDWEITLPAAPWRFAVGTRSLSHERNTLLLGSRSEGDLILYLADDHEVSDLYHQRGIDWPVGGKQVVGERVHLRLHMGRATWQLQMPDGATLQLDAPPSQGPVWIRFLVPANARLHNITVQGQPNDIWLEARRELVTRER